jgi:hypothetical protein
MSDTASINTLNRLLTILHRSLPMYLSEASPWRQQGDEQAAATLAQIVANQQRDCRRIAELVLERHGAIDLGEFPMEFTDLHFLSLDFLTKELVRYQKRVVADIENCVARLADDPRAHTLAQEVLGSERAHLDLLEELAHQPA